MKKMSSTADREKARKRLIRGYVMLVVRVAVIAAVLVILFSKVFLVCRMKGMDMFPAVRDGDLLIAFRLQQDYQKNDVVIYRSDDGQRRIGRIAARGSDWLEITENGTLKVNGTVQRGEILYPTYPRENAEYPLQVPAGSVYVLGDQRTESRDSRDFGPIPSKSLEGKLISLFRRRGL